MTKKGDNTEDVDQAGGNGLLQSASLRPRIPTNDPSDAEKKRKNKKKKRKYDRIEDAELPNSSETGVEREHKDTKGSSKDEGEKHKAKKRKKSRQIEENVIGAVADGGAENGSEHEKGMVNVTTGLKTKAENVQGEAHFLDENDAKEKTGESKQTKKSKRKTKNGVLAQFKDEALQQPVENDVADNINYGVGNGSDDTEEGRRKEKRIKRKEKRKAKLEAEVDGSVDDKERVVAIPVEPKVNWMHNSAIHKTGDGASKEPLNNEGVDKDKNKRKEKKEKKEKKEVKKRKSLRAVMTSKHANGGELFENWKDTVVPSAATTAESPIGGNANVVNDVGDLKDGGKFMQITEEDIHDSGAANEPSVQIIRLAGNELSQTGEADRPTTEEIFARASKKRKVFLHGCAAVPFPSREHVHALDDAERHKFIKTSASFCERLVHVMHKLIVSANQWMKIERKDDFIAIEEALTNDMARLKKLPLARQYVEMTLWRRILQLNQDHLQAASKIGFGKGLVHSGGPHQGLVLHLRDDPDAAFVSYREAHMSNLVERFQDSLEKMRNIEKMDSGQAHFLLRCLDAGSNLFANLKCLDKKQHERANNSLTSNDNSKGK